MQKKSKIFVAGHRGLVGSAIVRALQADGYTNIVTRTRQELDLLDANAVEAFFAKEKIEYVFDAAAKVGGIMANKQYPADFIYQNLTIQNHLIQSSYKNGVKKFLFLGSSCVYPKQAVIPIKESSLLTGPLEETNIAYAMAKISGIIMGQSYNIQYPQGTRFISAMPTNIYGPNDNFDLETSHVLPALIRKFHDAKVNNMPAVTLWGTGSPLREFLHTDDLAACCVFLMNTYDDSEIVNVGTGKDISIKEIAEVIKGVVGYSGKIVWDNTKPDGTYRKVMDVSKLNALGISAKIGLKEGIVSTYEWFEKFGKK